MIAVTLRLRFAARVNYCNTLLTVSNLVSQYNYYDLGSIIEIASTSIIITGCKFRNNHQSTPLLGGIIRVYNSQSDISIEIYETEFISNEAAYILMAQHSVINTENSKFKYNHGSAMDLSYCKVNIVNSVFNNNEAHALRLSSTIIHIRGSEFKGNIEEREGGALYSRDEILISFSEICTFADNRANKGGAIFLGYKSRVQWFVAHEATVVIANNTALYGGGIHLDYYTNLTIHTDRWSTLQILNNRATQNGGGIYVSKHSSINLSFNYNNIINQTSNSTKLNIYKNQARNGGGLYLERSSFILFPCLNSIINFDENVADYGGAVFISTTNFPGPVQHYHLVNDLECFFQSETLRNPGVCKQV